MVRNNTQPCYITTFYFIKNTKNTKYKNTIFTQYVALSSMLNNLF